MTNSEARTRLLDAAEAVFAGEGFAAARIKEIARIAGVRHTTLYHHAPGGKADLYLEVMERGLDRHREGLAQAAATASDSLEGQLRAMARWLLDHPYLDVMRLLDSNAGVFSSDQTQRLSQMAVDSLIQPFANVLAAAATRGLLAPHDAGVIGGGLFGMIEVLHGVPPDMPKSRVRMSEELIAVVLRGLQPASPTA